MFHVILFEPEIPPNTGNIIRLCANTGASLSLVGRLGFELDEPRLRRAGLDYHEFARIAHHPDLYRCLEALGQPRLWCCSSRGGVLLGQAGFAPGDAFLFGPETRGLSDGQLDMVAESYRLRIPMRPGNRSLNLSNAVAVTVYEAWRQQDYSGGG
ncbi:MAG: tRNA (cytidine(34)-2'-O)-methyltransferase [Gammaproteobacteria bacterium]